MAGAYEEVYRLLGKVKDGLDKWEQDERQLEQLLTKKFPGMTNEDMMREYNRLRFSSTPLSDEDSQRCSELGQALRMIGWVQ